MSDGNEHTGAPGDPIISSDVLREQRLPPGQVWTATDRRTGKPKWPVLDATGAPRIDRAAWSLRLFGCVEAPVALDWSAFSALPRARVRCDIHCVTRWSRKENVFEGPLVRTVLERVRVLPSARFVLLHALDEPDGQPWTTNLPLDEFTGDDCLFATHHEGEPLTLEHGGPCRVVVPRLYFWKSAKWVCGVEFMEDDRPGYWEQAGYHMHGDPWTEERVRG